MSNQKKDNSNSVAWTILTIIIIIVFVVIVLVGIGSSMSEYIVEVASTSNTVDKNSSSTKTQSNVSKQETEKSKEEHIKFIEEQKSSGVNRLKEIRQAYKQNELSAKDKYEGNTYYLCAKLDSIYEERINEQIIK